MKLAVMFVVLVMALAIVGIGVAMAVPPGKTLEWTPSMGTVTFSGQVHADKGLKCADCHPKIFQMKKGTMEATVADHNAGEKFCWTCHNGTKAFEAKGNCTKCHVK